MSSQSPYERFFSASSELRPKSLYGIAMFYYRLLLLLTGSRILGSVASASSCNIKGLLKEQSLHELWENKDKLSTDIARVLEAVYSSGGKAPPDLSDLIKNTVEKNCDKCCEKYGRELRCIIEWYPELLIPERARNLLDDPDTQRFLSLFQKSLEKVLTRQRDALSRILAYSKTSGIPLRVRPTNYYALLYIDMDTATPFFQGITMGEIYAAAASSYLVSEVFKRGIYSRVVTTGMPGFIGGDDAVFFLPPEDAFTVLASYTSIHRDLGMKASAAIVYAHSRIPLGIAIARLFRSMALAKSSRLGPYKPKNSVAVTRITGTGKTETYILPEVAVGGYEALSRYVKIGAYYAFQRNITPSFNTRVKTLQKALSSDDSSYVALAISKLEEALEEGRAGKELLALLYALAGKPDRRPIFRAFAGLLSIISSSDILGSSIFPEYEAWGEIR